jgi:putative ubiquitin-RnfH superfamily antitoxin RatB of RatAB toxin-antitoxin module
MAAISVEVVYALPEGEDAVIVRLPVGATAGEAVVASGIAARHPGVDLTRLGVFGKAVAADARVADGDRVEIYRPLRMDPKDARRRRARKT